MEREGGYAPRWMHNFASKGRGHPPYHHHRLPSILNSAYHPLLLLMVAVKLAFFALIVDGHIALLLSTLHTPPPVGIEAYQDGTTDDALWCLVLALRNISAVTEYFKQNYKGDE